MTDEEKRIYRSLLSGMIGSDVAADTIIRTETLAGNLGSYGRGFAIMQEFRDTCPIPPAAPTPPAIAQPKRTKRIPHEHPEAFLKTRTQVTREEAGMLLGLSERRIRNLIEQGNLKTQGEGYRTMVTAASIWARIKGPKKSA